MYANKYIFMKISVLYHSQHKLFFLILVRIRGKLLFHQTSVCSQGTRRLDGDGELISHQIQNNSYFFSALCKYLKTVLIQLTKSYKYPSDPKPLIGYFDRDLWNLLGRTGARDKGSKKCSGDSSGIKEGLL